MQPRLTTGELAFLFGTAVVITALLVTLAYALRKALRRTREPTELRPTTPRADDPATFMIAALQGVIGDLKEEQKKQQAMYQSVENQASDTARLMETTFQEMGEGLIVFDKEGFLTRANPAVRGLLGLDTWSRRRFPEVFGPESELTELVRACLASGQAIRGAQVDFRTSRAEVQPLAVSVLPLQTNDGSLVGVVCLLQGRAHDT